jgi:hypothetical protein
MENRRGLTVDACLTPASGHAERIAALAMIEPHADRPVAGGRQGLRHSRLRERAEDDERAAARRPKHDAALCGGRANHTPSRLRGEPARPQADRGSFRLDEDHRRMRRPMLRGTNRVGWASTFATAPTTRLPSAIAEASGLIEAQSSQQNRNEP